jgi:hypothetical protein
MIAENLCRESLAQDPAKELLQAGIGRLRRDKKRDGLFDFVARLIFRVRRNESNKLFLTHFFSRPREVEVLQISFIQRSSYFLEFSNALSSGYFASYL